MTRPARSTRFLGALPLAAAVVLSAATLPARAQGTPEQREACAPDAINLCSDTIPDVPKTTACMKAHEAQLSPGCHRFFLEATKPPPQDATPDSQVDRDGAAPDDDDDAMSGPPPSAPPDADADASNDPVANYRLSIIKACRQHLIDPFTCHNTLAILNANR